MSLYRTGDGLLMFWSHEFVAPWQTDAWRESMRRALRPAQYQRMIENRWTTSEEAFITAAEWDRCIDPGHRMVVSNPQLPVWVGLDASTKRDSTAIVACTWDPLEQNVWLVWHKIFTPTSENPIDFNVIEREILVLAQRFQVYEVRYDPFQLASTAQRLRAMGVPMTEVPMTSTNLTEATTALYDAIKQRRLVVYEDKELRDQVLRAIVAETSRGWRLDKLKASHKIDAAVALSMAVLATQQGNTRRRFYAVGF